MRETFTIGRRHGEKTFEIVLGPDAAPRAHRALLKEIIVSKEHGTWAEIVKLNPIRRVFAGRLSKRVPRKRQRPAKPVAVKPKAVTTLKKLAAFGNRLQRMVQNGAGK